MTSLSNGIPMFSDVCVFGGGIYPEPLVVKCNTFVWPLRWSDVPVVERDRRFIYIMVLR